MNVNTFDTSVWSYPLLRTFWADIFHAYSTTFGVVIPPNPLCAIFGFTDKTRFLKGRAHVVIAFTSLLVFQERHHVFS